MCVICIQPADKYLDRDTAKAMWTTNPDGGGFAYINDQGTITVEKHMTFKRFWGAFENARSTHRDKDFLVHMRIATHGEVNLDNVHPFVVDENTVMAHNGIIHGVEDDPTNQMSDTRVFIKDVLPELPPTWLDSKYMGAMVSEWIGWSKLAFLTVNPDLNGRIYVVNEHKGNWDNGMWFSNLNHKRTVTKSFGSSRNWESPTGYNGGTAAGQTWNPTTGKWEDNASRGSEDDMKTYSSMKEYWDDTYPATGGTELYLDKGGESFPAAQLPWSNTISLEERAKLTPEWEQLVKIRNECKFEKPFAYDDEFGYWWCYGCDEAIDVPTGICDCWDKYCVDCTHVAAECTCQMGYSNNLTNIIDFVSKERSMDELPSPL